MLTDFIIVLVTLLGPALGGATDLLTQAIVVLSAALLIIVSPPRRPPPGLLMWPALMLAALASISFFPATWLPMALLRDAFSSAQIPVARTFSMQPWIGCEHFLLLVVSLLWALYLFSRPWVLSRQVLLRLYAGGITLLSMAAIIFFLIGWRPKLWHSEGTSFGFFPNPDQTGILLATAGVVSMALVFSEFVRTRSRLWLLCYALNLAALFFNRSHKGLVIHVLGVLLWLSAMTWSQRKTDSLWRWQLGTFFTAIIFMIVLLMPTEFTRRPGSNPAATANAFAPSGMSRRVQIDALKLFRDASWQGIGLGNFESIFAHYRNLSKAESRVIHPENDWLWMGIEMGWLAPILVLGVLAYYIATQKPRASEPDAGLRWATLSVMVMYLLYSFVSVSGHRLGSVWSALLLLAVMRREPDVQPGQRSFRVPFRSLGIGMCAVGLWWFTSACGGRVGLTSALAAHLKREMFDALRAEDFVNTTRAADQGLRWSPLDWQWYFGRALAQMHSPATIGEALNDFHRARVLEPNSPQTPFEEAKAWLLTRAPMWAFQAWQETLRRAPTNERTNYFQAMLELGKGIPPVQRELFSLAATDRELLLVFMAFVEAREFQEELDKLLLEDPTLGSLSAEQKQRLLTLWFAKGDRVLLDRKLRENPAWRINFTPSSPLSPQGKAP